MAPPTQSSQVPENPQVNLTEWMQAYGDDIWTYIYTLVHRKEVADDLSQDVFIRAFTHAVQFRGHSSVKTWLLAIARNAVKDYQRSAFARRVTLSDDVERQVEEASETAHVSSVEDTAVEQQEVNDIWNVIMDLEPIYREVLILRLREDLSFAEISTITGLSDGNLRVRYQRALKKVRKELGLAGGKTNAGV